MALIFVPMSHFQNASEENYLKALYKLEHKVVKKVNNTALAKLMGLNPATVLEMVRKMAKAGLVKVEADKSLTLTEKGRGAALQIVRRHRLWEVFLVAHLGYPWTEVHNLAEQLEHIQSDDLVDRLDAFLGHPTHDPHGDPIPDRKGRIKPVKTIALSDAQPGHKYLVKSFTETADSFLNYLDKLGIQPGKKMQVLEINLYDGSVRIAVAKKELQVSDKVAVNILLQPQSS